MQTILSPSQRHKQERADRIAVMFDDMQGNISAIVLAISKKERCSQSTVRNVLTKKGLIGGKS